MHRLLIFLFCTVALWHCGTVLHVRAENLTVSLRVGISSFTVSGYTAPSAMVTLIQNGVTAGTTTADVNGNFSKTIEALDPAIYTFHIYSTDSTSKVSNRVEYVVAIGEGQNLSLNNLLLPPSLTLDTLDSSLGEDVRIWGESYPSSTIRLFLADTLMATYTTRTDGRWYGLISTTNRQAGEYHVYAHASHPEGYQSIPSIGYTLTLRPRGVLVPSTPPSSDLQQRSQLLPPDLTPSTTATVDITSPTPLPTDLTESNMIRMILVDVSRAPVIWLVLLVLVFFLTWLMFFLKRRRK